MPWVLGPMMLRPGTQYVGDINDDLANRILPFIFSNSDLALIECTNSVMRVWVVSGDTETLVTRASVSTTVPNGDFSASAGWTLTASGTGNSVSISGGKLLMDAPAIGGTALAKRSFTVAGGDQSVEHAFRIVVDRGPVRFRCGMTDGADDLISETTLDTGVHSLAFTPTAGDVYIQFETLSAQEKIVDGITIEAAGAMELPTTWDSDDIAYLRYAQSGDVVFVACQGQQQRRIERRAVRSWSFVLYKPDDGPFQVANGADITLTPAALSGNTTLTASRAYFKSTHVGCLFRLFSSGQQTSDSLGGDDTFTSAIRVTGVSGDRTFNYAITGTWTGTLTLQRSLDGPDSGFVNVTTFTSNTTSTYNDGLANSIVWYRIGFDGNTHSSGTADIALTYAGGSGAGICRVTGFTSTTVVDVEVLSAFSSLDATDDWNEGDWSDVVGWPSSVAFHDGRLWWAGRDKIWGSISDAYSSFDIDYEGDAGPINRSVGFGPVDIINWLLPLSRLIVGREGAETSIRSSSFDEPLTPTNFTLKDCSTQGSAPVQAVKIDTRGVFVQQSDRRAYELSFNAEIVDYAAHDLTRLNPDIGQEGFVDLAVQRQPDTQLHFIRGDGKVAVLLHDREDEVEAWWKIVTDGASGEVEGVCVLPGAQENRVYYSVKRTVNGSTKRFLEKLAKRDECDGQPSSKCADSHVVYTGGTTTVPVAHLEGASVVAWAWDDDDTSGVDLGVFTVSSGSITIPQAYDNVVAGLGYTALFKSAKLAYAADAGTALNQIKKVNRLGLVLANTHSDGLEYGQNFTRMDNLPGVKDGVAVAANTVHDEFDGPMITVPGNWDTDARLCLRATAPKPSMVCAVVVDVSTSG